mmetsp:Transcript_5277/g.13118  ORF Transcript_5277/g.13118 Transcript_5277/m.13118 type:complete len:254 (-) Transcript_5277:2035-2796(-)
MQSSWLLIVAGGPRRRMRAAAGPDLFHRPVCGGDAQPRRALSDLQCNGRWLHSWRGLRCDGGRSPGGAARKRMRGFSGSQERGREPGRKERDADGSQRFRPGRVDDACPRRSQHRGHGRSLYRVPRHWHRPRGPHRGRRHQGCARSHGRRRKSRSAALLDSRQIEPWPLGSSGRPRRYAESRRLPRAQRGPAERALLEAQSEDSHRGLAHTRPRDDAGVASWRSNRGIILWLRWDQYACLVWRRPFPVASAFR